LATGAQLARLDYNKPVNAVAFSPHGTRVATASGSLFHGGGGSTQVFDAVAGVPQARLDHDGAVVAVAFSSDGTRVAIASKPSVRFFEACVICRPIATVRLRRPCRHAAHSENMIGVSAVSAAG